MSQANCTIDSCESTNDFVRQLGEAGHAQGTWIRARQQTRGRGRHGRTWVSQSGNLFLSVLVRDVPVANWSWVPLASAVAALRTLNHIDLKIKWPNDIWLSGSKVGGVLCEGVSGQTPFLVVGIGLNLFENPEEVSNSRAFYQNFQGPEYDREAEIERVRKNFLKEFQIILESVRRSQFDDIRVSYERSALFSAGVRIHWRNLENPENGVNTDVNVGDVIGLGPHAELQVLKTDGQLFSLYSEEVLGLIL